MTDPATGQSVSTPDLEPMPSDWTRALAVVAHPDDVEFAAAGAVAAWTAAGKTVSYLLVSRGEAGIDGIPPAEAAAVREAEQRASAAIVGTKEIEFLDYPDGVIEYGLPLRRHRPELVIGFNHRDTFPGGKRNSADHRNVGLALLDAVGDAGNRWVFADLGLEPWAGIRYVAMGQSPSPTHAVDVSDSLDLAVASLEQHSAYLSGLNPPITDVRGPLVGFATMTGQRFGGRPAVAFELVPR